MSIQNMLEREVHGKVIAKQGDVEVRALLDKGAKKPSFTIFSKNNSPAHFSLDEIRHLLRALTDLYDTLIDEEII